jgi:hypothetical protein
MTEYYEVYYEDGLGEWKHYRTYCNKRETWVAARWLRWNGSPVRVQITFQRPEVQFQ